MRSKGNIGIFIILMLVGLVIGSFLGEVLGSHKYFAFLNFGREFGINLDNPFVLDLNVIKLSFALLFKINIASIIGFIISIFVFRSM